MERQRGSGGGGGGDRYGNSLADSHHHYNSTRYSRGGPPNYSRSDNHHHRRSPNNTTGNNINNNYRGGGGGGAHDYHRAFDSPPRYHHPPPPPPSSGGSAEGGGGFRPISSGRGGGEDRDGGFNSNYPMAPVSGQKRGYSYPDSRGSPSGDRFEGGNFIKLFVGSVPRTAMEEDIRPLFDDQGRVLEVALIRDKRTGQHQGCCFVKYATSEEADRAIRALHNQYTLPGGVGPLQVRYADGERERLVEFKLFVGSLNKQATESEIEEIFAPYGRVEDVYLMRDDMRQSRGCGFVKYSQREMALAAINALNGTYTMQGCDQPLTVRFADPKRPRLGESRGGAPAYGGPGFAPRPRFPTPGIRPPTNLGEPLHERIPPNAWQPMSPQNVGTPPNAGMHGFGNQLLPRSGDIDATLGRILGSERGNPDRSLPSFAVSSTPMSQSNYNQPLPQMPSVVPQISPVQKPVQSPQHLTPLSLQPSNAAAFVHPQISHASLRPVTRVQMPQSSGRTPLNQALPSHQLTGLGGQLSVSQPQLPLSATSVIGQASRTSNFQPNVMSAMPNQQQLPAPVQSHQPPNQSPSQLAQLLAQQTQTLQATFQSSQQAFSQLQQQLQMMQPSNQNSVAQQGLQSSEQQSLWAGTVPQKVFNASTDQLGGDVAAASSANSASSITRALASGKCNWTEHTSPEGYKYYYNSTTGESKWEKPEELTLYEQQQQQKPPVQQPQVQPMHPQNLSVQNVPQRQFQVQNQLQTHMQSQIRPQQSLQSSQSLPYQVAGAAGHQNVQELSYTQVQPVTGSKSMDDPAHIQQRHQPAQEWMWKNKPAGM
ncbi:hypothetical protein ACH5RR_033571 [Cinchona calisaya]|uniref:Flowering time control protein FCA n=1 Tax=Cinchona calisaya TaxID=153742 RepID=A0ABD2YNG7_9GENT